MKILGEKKGTVTVIHSTSRVSLSTPLNYRHCPLNYKGLPIPNSRDLRRSFLRHILCRE